MSKRDGEPVMYDEDPTNADILNFLEDQLGGYIKLLLANKFGVFDRGQTLNQMYVEAIKKHNDKT